MGAGTGSIVDWISIFESAVAARPLTKFSPTIGMVGPWASISRDPDRQRLEISEHTLSRGPSDRWFLLLLSRRRC
jgi:hypothetical protein